MFRQLRRPLAQRRFGRTPTGQSALDQRRLLRWAWPAFTVALAVVLRVRRRAAQRVTPTVSAPALPALPVMNPAHVNSPGPSPSSAASAGHGPARAATTDDVPRTTPGSTTAASAAARPGPTLDAAAPARAEFPAVEGDIRAAPSAALAPPFPPDQPPPDDAAVPRPPRSPGDGGAGELGPADAPTAAPRPDGLAAPAMPAVAAAPSPPPTVPDDLTVIEGIGPKIAAVLRTAGITTFRELAATAPEALQQLLRQAGIRMGDATTWPEQAALAADGKTEALKALQDALHGGRRV